MIRKATFHDLEAINQIYNIEVDTQLYNVSTEPMKLEERIHWFESRSERYPVLVKELNHQVIAWASLNPWTNYGAYTRTAEISIFISPEARGQGWGKALLSAIMELGETLNHRVFLARIIEGNESSVHLFKKFGFVKVALMPELGEKLGRKFTVLILQKNLS